jgi:hypothetical protein
MEAGFCGRVEDETVLGRDEKSIKDNGNSTESEILCVFPLECYDFIAGITVRQRSRKEWSAEHRARSMEQGSRSRQPTMFQANWKEQKRAGVYPCPLTVIACCR